MAILLRTRKRSTNPAHAARAKDRQVGRSYLRQVHLAGAFGDYINRTSARRIGLLRVPLDRIVPAENTALRGTNQALFENAAAWDAVASRMTHVSLNEDPAFQEIYVEEVQFPLCSENLQPENGMTGAVEKAFT